MIADLIMSSKTPAQTPAALTAPRDSIYDEASDTGKNGENYRIRDVANMVTEVVPKCEVALAS